MNKVSSVVYLPFALPHLLFLELTRPDSPLLQAQLPLNPNLPQRPLAGLNTARMGATTPVGMGAAGGTGGGKLSAMYLGELHWVCFLLPVVSYRIIFCLSLRDFLTIY